MEVAILTIPKSNCLRPTFTYFPRKIGLDTVKFALVLVIAGKGVLQHIGNDEETKQWKQRRFWHSALRRQLSVLAGEGCAGLGDEGLGNLFPLANRPLVAVRGAVYPRVALCCAPRAVRPRVATGCALHGASLQWRLRF